MPSSPFSKVSTSSMAVRTTSGVLPVEILGTVYERFLGKVIRLTAGHQAKVEKKPEVRKSGGVYYTPAYIVNYIINNTIGKQIEGKSPADLAGGKTTPPFRVLDMACGSGSFLLGAYQILLDHCLKWYQTNLSKKHAKAVYQNVKGETCCHASANANAFSPPTSTVSISTGRPSKPPSSLCC